MSDAVTKAFVDNLCIGLDATMTGTTSGQITLNTPSGCGPFILNLPGLSSSEIDELSSLLEERKQLLKVDRLSRFKKWPSETREYVVNYLNVFNLAQELDSEYLHEPSHIQERITELQKKDNRVHLQYNHNISSGYSFAIHPAAIDLLLKHLSSEDIIQAHLEQSLEDELLKTSTDSINKHE